VERFGIALGLELISNNSILKSQDNIVEVSGGAVRQANPPKVARRDSFVYEARRQFVL